MDKICWIRAFRLRHRVTIAELAQMEAELSACPNIFTMEQGDQDGV